jgi:DNA modification methylase
MIAILIGDALEKLKELPDESVHCVVTSPPYWGLRDYSKCNCLNSGLKQDDAGNRTYIGFNARWLGEVPPPVSPKAERTPAPECPICNGTGIIEAVGEHQLGLEKTPEEYVNNLVEVFREVRRVLRGDGAVWLNLGDSYASEPYEPWGIKPKDEVGIPDETIRALRKDGWYRRSTVIWNKPNPMPESVRDRPTKSHEYIFLLTKSARYFFDQEAVREPMLKGAAGSTFTDGKTGVNGLGRVGRGERVDNPTGRNIRSVWTMTTKPYAEAHFATFPPELPERCIKAGTSLRGCCPKCGAPWERVVDKVRPEGWVDEGPTSEHDKELRAMSQDLYGGNQKSRSISDIYGRATKSEIKTTGWQPTCKCGLDETIPCTVLDIFAGSGTTGMVAKNLGRDAILIELNPEYERLMRLRAGLGVEHGPLDEFSTV